MTKEEAIAFNEEHRKASKEFALECLILGVTDNYAWKIEEDNIDFYYNNELKRINQKYEGKN